MTEFTLSIDKIIEIVAGILQENPKKFSYKGKTYYTFKNEFFCIVLDKEGNPVPIEEWKEGLVHYLESTRILNTEINNEST